MGLNGEYGRLVKAKGAVDICRHSALFGLP